MRYILLLLIICFLEPSYGQSAGPVTNAPVYKVARLKKSMAINAKWDKAEWKKIKSVQVANFIRENPSVKPDVQAKMMYDNENIYVIFHVKDQFVRAITTEINGPVWKDSAVEFFFSPDTAAPLSFFNMEVNAGGTHLLGFRKKKPELEDIKRIEIAHSLPSVIDPEIKEPVEWTIECRIPLGMLEKYSTVARPAKGISWKANFYKIAENNSNPHHASWALITHPKPTFHMPQFFGTLTFK